MKTHFLYEKFKNWEDDYDSIYIYSDPHFIGNGTDKDAVDTHNIFKYEDDEIQIANINKVCHKNDLIIFLGDMGSLDKINQIKCRNRILITGNHDAGNEIYKPYFLEIYNGPLFINNKLLLSHESLHSEKYFNIHGHLHNQSEIDGNNFHENYICISANLFGYRPLCLTDLFKRKGEFKYFKGYSDFKPIHRNTIDRAIIRKQERNGQPPKPEE